MSTEIFIEPELAELEQPEQAQQWFEIASQLNLTNQLIHADRSEEKKAPPYMHVDAKTSRIIMVLCPVQREYAQYKASTIPLDVLKEIAKCEKNKWYSKICICYDDKSPDPFVLGFTHNESKWQRDIHLIARWGAELIPFELLEKKAIDRLRNRATAALKELEFKAKYAIDNIDAFIENQLATSQDIRLDFAVNEPSKY